MYPSFFFPTSRLQIYQHWPKPFWHPAQQYRRLEPHLPAAEQHWLPGQVLLPLNLPHLPLVLTLLAADVLAGGAAEVGEGVGRTEVATVDCAGAGAEEAAGEDVPHLPKSGLQEAPQWSAVLPHQPYWEQHSPSDQPRQLEPEVPPQEPSVEGLPWTEAEAAGALEAAVGDATAALDDHLSEEPHTPKTFWQPVPQWSVVVPHQPAWEQQLPNSDPPHVKPVLPPQFPFVETAVGVTLGAADEVGVPPEAG